MEATVQPVTQPLSDVDHKVLSVMEKLGWGVTASKLAEYTDIEPGTVLSSLSWMAQQGVVASRKDEKLGYVYWYLSDRAKDFDTLTVCSACGKQFKNAQGLAIHQARAGHNKAGSPTVWISNDATKPEQHDYMSMDVEPRTLSFVQDILKRFADLPGVSIRVTVEFKGAGA